MSSLMVRLGGVKRAAAVVVAVAALGVLAPAAAWAAPVPASGPVAGGTSVSDIAGVTFTHVSAGYYHSLAIGSDGNTYAWGDNDYGQLGDGTGNDSKVPVQVKTPQGVTFSAVSASDRHSVAVGSDGNTYAWGDNDYGQLGDGTGNDSKVPVQVKTPQGVTFTHVSADGNHSVALGSDGNTYAWGVNDYGQLGDGTTENSNRPVQVKTPQGVTFTHVSAGYYHSVAIGSDGNTYAWGDNVYGQLGNDTRDGSSRPVQVNAPNGVTFTHVSAGGNHSVALGSDGNTYAWGDNVYGQLGDGTFDGSNHPVRVNAPNGVTFTHVSAGGNHSVALGSDGNTYAWGRNYSGQLGNDTNTNSNSPVQVKTPQGVTFTHVSAGGDHSVTLGSDKHAYAWGWNLHGQLGDGTSGADTNAKVPVGVSDDVTVTDVLFGAVSRTGLSQSGNTWTATSPTSPTCGPVDVTVTYNQFGTQHTATTPGGFTYTGTGPEITTQPASTTLAPGGTFTATARASGQPTPTIHWQQSTTAAGPWTTIPGATAATLTTTNTATTYYRAVFTGCGGATTTNTATATITAPNPTNTPTQGPTNTTTTTATPSKDTHANALPRTGTNPTPLIATAIALLLAGTTTLIAKHRKTSPRN